jgi:(1->4)-alpha-D-glucan 1-alpha-D-glucosylmutase
MSLEPERVPGATYRLQFRREFGFAAARDVVGYLADLGVTDLYASPLFRARPESTHGYDEVDPRSLDPRLGTPEEFEELSRSLADRGMGLLLDIVPNHMAASAANPWFRDVLEKGRRSPFARFFDIDWSAEEKTLLPILGETLSEAIEKGHLSLEIADSGLAVRYFDRSLPIDPATYGDVLLHRSDLLRESLDAEDPLRREFRRLLERIEALPPSSERPAGLPGGRREEVKRRLLELYRSRETLREFLDENIQQFNDTGRDPALLARLLEQQAYRLAFWHEAARHLNYRRFFNISDLIGVRVEDPEVFEAMHVLALRLVGEGKVTGLRVDHVDGLLDPGAYLERLQSRLAASAGRPGPFFVVVEKILEGTETLPASWPVCGTTGYEFLRDLQGLFLDPEGLSKLREGYVRRTGRGTSRGEAAYEEKRRIIETRLAPEAGSLSRALEAISRGMPGAREVTARQLERAIVEMTASLPVYRTYVRGPEPSPEDRRILEATLASARGRGNATAASLDVLARVLLPDASLSLSEEERGARLAFVQRWQQFAGPAMAKGVEDTLFYLDTALLSVNEVGCDARAVGPEEFHRRMEERLRSWPHGLNASSTHDTKRSEDVRSRLNILTELAPEWEERLDRWMGWNAPLRPRLGEIVVPDVSEETLLYQTLLGAWPLWEREERSFLERLSGVLVKSLREGKRHSQWIRPDRAYEAAFLEFARRILEPSPENRFLSDFHAFRERVAAAGALHSLSQTLLKIASPGVPDFYQGTELWDFSLVDPDNRRPVNFPSRRAALAQLDAEAGRNLPGLLLELRREWRDGRIKLYVISRALRARSANPRLFARGAYAPVETRGPDASRVIAVARSRGNDWCVAAVPRQVAVWQSPTAPLGDLSFKDTTLELPRNAPRDWRDALTGETRCSEAGLLPVQLLLRDFPVALLLSQSPARPSAGETGSAAWK